MTILQAVRVAAKSELSRNKDTDEWAVANSTLCKALNEKLITRAEWFELRRRALLELEPTYCPACKREDCKHRECYRRLPESVGGLGLCYNLKKEVN